MTGDESDVLKLKELDYLVDHTVIKPVKFDDLESLRKISLRRYSFDNEHGKDKIDFMLRFVEVESTEASSVDQATPSLGSDCFSMDGQENYYYYFFLHKTYDVKF